MKGWVGWPVADGLPTLVVTHQLQGERRTGKVRQSERDVLSLCHTTNSNTSEYARLQLNSPADIRINRRWVVCLQLPYSAATQQKKARREDGRSEVTTGSRRRRCRDSRRWRWTQRHTAGGSGPGSISSSAGVTAIDIDMSLMDEDEGSENSWQRLWVNTSRQNWGLCLQKWNMLHGSSRTENPAIIVMSFTESQKVMQTQLLKGMLQTKVSLCGFYLGWMREWQRIYAMSSDSVGEELVIKCQRTFWFNSVATQQKRW